LRGIAASGVLLYHLSVVSMMMLEAYRATSPFWLRHLFGLGSQGVTLFFVLSGFVIAHSLRHDSLSLQSLARFILRRQVRLDPPYWANALRSSRQGESGHSPAQHTLGSAVPPIREA
jgi:peptidoglycan/LPS O-acetylase OafA/YrhL